MKYSSELQLQWFSTKAKEFLAKQHNSKYVSNQLLTIYVVSLSILAYLLTFLLQQLVLLSVKSKE